MILIAVTSAALALVNVQQAPSETMAVDDVMARENVKADYFVVDVDAAQFARGLIEAEGLTSWNGEPQLEDAGNRGFGVLSIRSGEGRSATVWYSRGLNEHEGRVCRSTANANGMGPGSYRAVRWCLAKFGVEAPETPPPLIKLPSQ